jgi:hypothetical protein
VKNFNISNEYTEHLKNNGYINIGNPFSEKELEDLTVTVNKMLTKYPYGFIHNSPYSGITPTPNTAMPEPTAHSPTVIIPHFAFLEPSLIKPLANPELHDFIEKIIGKDFYLSNTWFQMVPPETGRMSYHKDHRGSINFNILLDDIDAKMGSTCIMPGSHINTPPVQFCMKNALLSQNEEVELTGKTGDLVFFSTEAMHGRAENNSKKWTKRLFFSFFSRSSRATTTWNGVVTNHQLEEAKAVIPSAYHHMFEINAQQTEQLASVNGGALKKWALSKSSCNYFFQDFAYAMLIYGRNVSHPEHTGHKLPYTSTLTESNKFSVFKYLSHMKLRPTIIFMLRFFKSKFRS